MRKEKVKEGRRRKNTGIEYRKEEEEKDEEEK